jgi:glyoxylase I family protein
MAEPYVPDLDTALVRYLVGDLGRAVTFYTEHLGFRLVQRFGPVIAIVARGNLHLLLSSTASSGARTMPDGRTQAPGGWNRIVLYVDSLEASIAKLENVVTFRNEIESGPGGRQILLDDPDGNPIELHEAPKS